MMIFAIVVLYVLVISLSILLWLLHMRLEDMVETQEKVRTWCNTLRENEETIMNDLKKVVHDFQEYQKENRRK